MPSYVPYHLRLTAETTIYQNEVKCRVLENDFNYSQNPTVFVGANYTANAVGTITIDSVGVTGDSISVFVNDPILGIVPLGSYVVTPADTSLSILATNIAAILVKNKYNYVVTVNQNTIIITAAGGLGNTINGGNNLIVNLAIVPGSHRYIQTQTGNNLITQNLNNIITQS
jgi:hypothetical protein